MVDALDNKSNPDAVRYNNYNSLSEIYTYVGKALAAYEKERGLKIVSSKK
jgi:hypothetical protein